MKKSAYISDILFTFFLTAIFTLCLFRYLKISMALSILLAVVCGALSATIIGVWQGSKRKHVFLKKSDETLKNKLLLHLCLLSDERKSALFYNLLRQTGEVKRIGKLRLVDENNFYFLLFRFLPVSPDDIATLTRLKTHKQKIVFCNEIDENALRLCARMNVKVCDGDEIFRLLRDKNALPEKYLGDSENDKKRKIHFKLCFSKRNSRRFFVGGALILLTSLLTPFPYYYLISGTALLIVAVCVRVFGYS